MACPLWLLLFVRVYKVHSLVDGPWSQISLGPTERARRLVTNMTLEEKLLMLHGPVGGAAQCSESPRCAYVGNVAPVQRLGIPPINMNLRFAEGEFYFPNGKVPTWGIYRL